MKSEFEHVDYNEETLRDQKVRDTYDFLNDVSCDLNDRICNGETVSMADILNRLNYEIPPTLETYYKSITFGVKDQLAFPLHRL